MEEDGADEDIDNSMTDHRPQTVVPYNLSKCETPVKQEQPTPPLVVWGGRFA